MKLGEQETKLFDTLYREHVDQVFRFCVRIGLGNRAWAEDRTQEVFVKLAENIAKLDDHATIGKWLRRVAMNACLMELRRQSRWRGILPRLGGSKTVNPAQHDVQKRQEISELRKSIEELPVKLRAVITLTYLMEHSQSEAANILEISKGEVSKRHKKALERLRKLNWKLVDDQES